MEVDDNLYPKSTQITKRPRINFLGICKFEEFDNGQECLLNDQEPKTADIDWLREREILFGESR